MRKDRESNFELLRILAMFMIIGCHFFAYVNAGEFLSLEYKQNMYFFKVMQSFCICGVNLFVLISGWFMVERNCINIRKIIDLILQVAWWGGIGFCLIVMSGRALFSVKELIKVMFPVITGGRWFVKAYIIYFLFIPFINLAISVMEKKAHEVLLLIMFILFCIWPTFFSFPPIDDYGYGFIHFVFLYVIVSYIKLYSKKLPHKLICLLGYIIFGGIITIESFVGISMAWGYNNIFVVFSALSLFLFFVQIEFYSKIVNILALCAFGVFLIHTDNFFSELIFGMLFHSSERMYGNVIKFAITFFVCLFVFYIFGFLLEWIRKISVGKVINGMINKCFFCNYKIEVVKKKE